MEVIDTHSHLFLEEFSEDLPLVIERAKAAGVTRIFMPNIDSSTIEPMLDVATRYKGYCYPMLGLHPTSVNADYKKELKLLVELLKKENHFTAIGEVGMDLYWDKTFLKEQTDAFDKQIQLALDYGLPLIIHSRDAFNEIVALMRSYINEPLTGIFHSFTGTVDEAEGLLQFKGFKLGINGVVTFKKSGVSDTLKEVPLERLVLETDSPYLAPVPNRGRRNESANIIDTLKKVAEVYQLPADEVARVTTKNALDIFKILE